MTKGHKFTLHKGKMGKEKGNWGQKKRRLHLSFGKGKKEEQWGGNYRYRIELT